MNSPRQLIITSRFIAMLKDICDYIRRDSYQNAAEFKKGVDKLLPRILKYPEANPLVRSISGKRRLYRYKLYKKHYKIVFKVLQSRVIVLGIVHTARHPKVVVGLRTTRYR